MELYITRASERLIDFQQLDSFSSNIALISQGLITSADIIIIVYYYERKNSLARAKLQGHDMQMQRHNYALNDSLNRCALRIS